MSLTIRQGDAYDIEVALWTRDGTVISPDIVSSVELVIGSLRKTYPGLVTYDDSADVWLLPLE